MTLKNTLTSLQARKIIMVILLLIMTIIGLFGVKNSFINEESFSSHQYSTTKALMILMKKDFINLKKSKSIPEKLYDVNQIEFFNKSDTLILTKSDLESFIKIYTFGKYKLTVDFYSFPDEKNRHLVQYNWINLKTNDKIWEINRVYNLDKKKPDHH